MNRFSSVLAFVVVVSVSAGAAADDVVPTVNKDSVEPTNSVNVSPLGLMIGAYSVNYERLMTGGHGLIVEGNYSTSSDSDSSASGAGVGIGYRWHWRGKQNSGFLGVNAGYRVGTGDATVTTNGMSEKFDVDTKVFYVTGNIGKRWAFDSGLNITLRVGAGYGNYDISTDSDDPDAQDAVDLVDGLLTLLPVALDGELSVGYAF